MKNRFRNQPSSRPDLTTGQMPDEGFAGLPDGMPAGSMVTRDASSGQMAAGVSVIDAKWEYLCVQGTKDAYFDHLGNNGWELVSAVRSFPNPDLTDFYFKRRLT